MADEKIGQAKLFLKILQQIDDLGLDRDIQRGDRFVADDEFGVQRQSSGDADALALAARKSVRVTVGKAAVEADSIHQLVDAGELFPGGKSRMLIQRLGDDRGHRHARVEAGLRVLEHHLHRRALEAQRLGVQCRDIDAVDGDRARRQLIKPQQRASDG